MPYPLLRKAEPRDYEAIWAIWMQDHIIQWMSFPKQSKEKFVNHYRRLEQESDIYVIVDKINNNEKVVAVRRIKFGKNEHRHIAEYCSMGVDQDLRGRGYGKLFYQEFEKIVRAAGVRRIQLTQEGGNEAAFHLADKNFTEEGVFPDWLKRENDEGVYYLIERYIYRLLDDEIKSKASQIQSLKYQEILPPVNLFDDTQMVLVDRVDNLFNCYHQNEQLLTIDFVPDTSVVQHIGNLSIKLHTFDKFDEAIIAFRKVLMIILADGIVKKLELFTADPEVAELCKNLGFFIRGEKIAAYYENGSFKNELGLEYSFFGIDDAILLIKTQVHELNQRQMIISALNKCAETFKSLIEKRSCDIFAARYFENLVYQMVRDNLGPNKVFSLPDKRWQPLVDKCPPAVREVLIELDNFSLK